MAQNTYYTDLVINPTGSKVEIGTEGCTTVATVLTADKAFLAGLRLMVAALTVMSKSEREAFMALNPETMERIKLL